MDRRQRGNQKHLLEHCELLVLVGKDNQPKPWRAFDAVSQLGTITHGHVYGGTAAVSQAAWNHFTNS